MPREVKNLGGLIVVGWLGEAYRSTKRPTTKVRYSLDVFTPRKPHTRIERRDNTTLLLASMALVAKSNHSLALVRNQQGQISIFFSASLVVLVSIIAFVINVGLFVKAKINLQNATDAAAFAGAAVQARQLSKIAHLNWEMRNVYKEWMYKYYVVGNLNINDVRAAAEGDATGAMSFRMESDVNAITGEVNHDRYNIPSVCIHLDGSTTNICKRYAIPGLPEFGSSNLPGAESASRAFQDALISTKINDCVERTKINMLVTSMWAYNVRANNAATFASRGPAVMADRQGAWPKAVEIAMRIRNLEKIVNRAPRPGSVCIEPGVSDKVNCTESINSVSGENWAGNERLVKAFYSGYRNVGGSGTGDGDEMKSSFTLTELAPTPFVEPSPNRASNLLIPPNEAPSFQKFYLDLKLMTVNYAVFYSAMIPRADTATSGACDVSKAAIPVPGYPLGFYKNPELLTYYAVKGEAEFIGMFNPFNEPVKLTTYAAAKPMGGRIGPMLFTQMANEETIKARNDTVKKRSIPYLASLDVRDTTQKLPDPASPPDHPVWKVQTLQEGDFAPGVPIPVNGNTDQTRFWLSAPDNPVGGVVNTPEGVQFAIPNLVYDWHTPFDKTSYAGDQSMQVFTLQSKVAPDGSQDVPIGLYSKHQFARFRGTLGNTVDAAALEAGVARVRAATAYEAANYLIPTPYDAYISTDLGSYGQISGTPQAVGSDGLVRYRSHIYAPLYDQSQQDVWWKTPVEVATTIMDFMRQQHTGMKKYRDAMNKVAITIDQQSKMASTAASGSASGYAEAAKGVSDLEDFNTVEQNPETCKSLLGTFLHFYWGGPVDASKGPTNPDPSVCPTPLGTLIQTYFSPGGNNDASFEPMYYTMDYSYYPDHKSLQASPVPDGFGIFSGYMPGEYTGVNSSTGQFSNLASNALVETMRRNFYSTKLIAIESILPNGGYTENKHNFVIYSEGEAARIQNGEGVQSNFINSIPADSELQAIKH